jgi:hypothetical protein
MLSTQASQRVYCDAMPSDIATATRRPVPSRPVLSSATFFSSRSCKHHFHKSTLFFLFPSSYFFAAPGPSPIKSFWKKSSTSCLPCAATGARKLRLVEDFTVCCVVRGQTGNEFERMEGQVLFSHTRSGCS